MQVPELAFDRKLRLIHRREGTLSHAAEALLAVVEAQTRACAAAASRLRPSGSYRRRVFRGLDSPRAGRDRNAGVAVDADTHLLVQAAVDRFH